MKNIQNLKLKHIFSVWGVGPEKKVTVKSVSEGLVTLGSVIIYTRVPNEGPAYARNIAHLLD